MRLEAFEAGQGGPNGFSTRNGCLEMNNDLKSVSVILPTFNESENIVALLDEISKTLRSYDFEIIVVDDNSPDGTARIVGEELSRRSQLRLIVRQRDRGLVPSIREGLSTARGDICVWMDADLSMRPETIVALVQKIRDGADLAIGSRYIALGAFKGASADGQESSFNQIRRRLQSTGDSFVQVVLSLWGSKLLGLLLSPLITDYTSGFFAIRRGLADKIELRGFYADYCINLAYEAVIRGFNVAEVPMAVVPRMKGESKTAGSLARLARVANWCLSAALSLRLNKKRIAARGR